MRASIEELRCQFEELRASSASITMWRSLQLQILVAARAMQRSGFIETAVQDRPFAGLWSLLSEPFWMEVDIVKLAAMIDDVLAELDSITATQQTRHGTS